MFEHILSALPRDAIEKLSDQRPMIRTLPFRPGDGGRTCVAGAVAKPNLIVAAMHVTARGHSYEPGDSGCCGCGAALDPHMTMAEAEAALDRQGRCPHPATTQDIASALLGHLRPKPARMRARVRFIPAAPVEATA